MGGNQFWRTTESFGPPLSIWILKVSRTQFLGHSLDFNAFCMIQETSDFWSFSKLKWGDLISWGEPVLQSGWIIWSPLLHLNLKSFKDPNSSLFIRFQCILHGSGVLFSEFLNFQEIKRGDLISWGEPVQQNE